MQASKKTKYPNMREQRSPALRDRLLTLRLQSSGSSKLPAIPHTSQTFHLRTQPAHRYQECVVTTVSEITSLAKWASKHAMTTHKPKWWLGNLCKLAQTCMGVVACLDENSTNCIHRHMHGHHKRRPEYFQQQDRMPV